MSDPVPMLSSLENDHSFPGKSDLSFLTEQPSMWSTKTLSLVVSASYPSLRDLLTLTEPQFLQMMIMNMLPDY